MKAGEFFIEMGIKGSDKVGEALDATNKGLKDASSNAFLAEKKVGDLAGSLSKLAGLGAIDLSIAGISKMGSEAGRNLHIFSEYTGESVKRVQELAHHLGVTNDEAASLLERASTLSASLKVHGASGLFGALGINLDEIHSGQDMINALQMASHQKGFYGADTQRILNMALQEAGLDPRIIGLIRGTKGNLFSPLSRDQYVTSSEAAKAALIQAKWVDLENKLQNLTIKLADVFGPALVAALNKFADVALGISGTVEKAEAKYPAVKAGIGQAGTALGVGAAGSSLGALIGGIIGLLGGPGGVLAGAEIGGLLSTGGAAAYFGGKDLSSWLSGAVSRNVQSSQTLNATIHVSVPAAGATAKKYVQKQTVGLTAGKTNDVNSAYQANQQTSGS